MQCGVEIITWLAGDWQRGMRSLQLIQQQYRSKRELTQILVPHIAVHAPSNPTAPLLPSQVLSPWHISSQDTPPTLQEDAPHFCEEQLAAACGAQVPVQAKLQQNVVAQWIWKDKELAHDKTDRYS